MFLGFTEQNSKLSTGSKETYDCEIILRLNGSILKGLMGPGICLQHQEHNYPN